jgi:hypothetical protein
MNHLAARYFRPQATRGERVNGRRNVLGVSE